MTFSATKGEAPIAPTEFKDLLHPREFPRFLLALFVSVGTIGMVSIVLLESSHKDAILIFLTPFLVALCLLLLFIWFFLQIVKARSKGNAVRVSSSNFPEVQDMLEKALWMLDYRKKVEIYIVDDGSFDARQVNFLGVRFIMLNSGCLADGKSQECGDEVMWLIGRFIGALKAKHSRFDLLSLVVSSVRQLRLLNFFILPYERATQLSGDQIGMALSNVRSGMKALAKMMAGQEIGDQANLRGLLEQSKDLHPSFFGILSALLSTHPHMTDRFRNLLAFARSTDPIGYVNYVQEFHDMTVDEVDGFLPDCYPKKPLPGSDKPVSE